MKKRLTEVLVLVCCIALLCGCRGKGSDANTNAESDITNKTGQDSFVLLPTENPTGIPSLDAGESSDALSGEGDAEAEAGIRYELAAMLPFEEGDDKICAIAYMGDSGAEHEANLTAFYEKYFPTMANDDWLMLPEFDCVGAQCYLVIPRYADCTPFVNFMDFDATGNLAVAKSEPVEQEAFLVYCNASPEYANSEVHFLYQEQHLVIVPRLSALDGKVEPMQVALDLTMDEVYQQ